MIVIIALLLLLTSQINRLLPLRQLGLPREVPLSMFIGTIFALSTIVMMLMIWLGQWVAADAELSAVELRNTLPWVFAAVLIEKTWWLWRTRQHWVQPPPVWTSGLYGLLAVLGIVALPVVASVEQVVVGAILGAALTATAAFADMRKLWGLGVAHYRWWEVVSIVPLTVLLTKAG